MSWREEIGTAYFRGVPFFVMASERSGGRRVVKHEYPLRDVPFAEDMGRKAREFSVDGYVHGDDYLTARNALMDALEASGSGELVHPFHGTRRVAVLEFRVRESSESGGMAQFSISFAETPANPVQPSSVPDAGGALRSSASAAADSVSTEFVATFEAGALMNSVVATGQAALAAVADVVSPLEFGVQDLALINLKLAALETSLAHLMHTPETLVAQLSELFACFVSGTRKRLLEVYTFTPPPRPPATTVNRKQERANFDALYRLIQRLIVIQAAMLTLDETFDSYEAAVAARESITDLLDEQADLAADNTYPALSQLRADVCKSVPGEDSDLPRIVTVTPPLTVPSLVLAYDLFGDVDREADIVARNGVSNPAGIIGGRPLEVLSRG